MSFETGERVLVEWICSFQNSRKSQIASSTNTKISNTGLKTQALRIYLVGRNFQ